MKFSERSLRNWVSTALNINVICEQLTISGLEVEEITNYIKDFDRVFIGVIISVKHHPDINSIYVVRVNIGIRFVITLCHFNNVKKNMKVFFAFNGARLFNNSIVESNGGNEIISEGILCTYSDLGISNGINQIIQLPCSAPIGKCIKDYNFYKDKIIKMNITFNRLDVFGVFGVAREVSLLNNFTLPKIINIKAPITIKEICKIHVQDNITYSCFGRLIKNINLQKKTPIWMQDKLRKHNISPVNVVVDIINYIFLELGQSIYVFSFKSTMEKIIVGSKNQGGLIFNKKNVFFGKDIILLKNASQVLSFLGSVDFDLFPINLKNKNLFIGSFFIDPNILSNSIYQVQSEHKVKSHEYFVDPLCQNEVIEYATNLFLRICGGNAGLITNMRSQCYTNYIYRKIKLRYKYILDFIGEDINYNVIENILVQLKYKVIAQKEFWYVIPPSWRPDILISEDVISDIMRIYQYDNVLSQPLNSNINLSLNNKSENFLKRAKYSLVDRGYYEVINYSFVDPVIQNDLNPNQKFLSLINPISKDMSCMRTSIWPGLIKNLIYHQNRQYDEVRFFESGLCFSPSLSNKLGVKQNFYFSGIIGNTDSRKYHWDIPARRFDFYDLKGDIESIFDSIGHLEDVIFKKKIVPGLHIKNSTYIILDNIIIGSMGELDPVLSKKFKIHYSTFLFELFWYKLNYKEMDYIRNVSDFPNSRRDISIILDENILIGDLVALCQKKFASDVESIQILDIYKGTSIIPIGKKSVTLQFLFQSMYETLTDRYINTIMKRCVKYLYETFNAILRS